MRQGTSLWRDEAMDKVVLRRWKDTKDIIALFPDIEADNLGHVQSYMHIGQHGAADYQHVISATRPVLHTGNDRERENLIRELVQIGYEPKLYLRR
jgi:hypothetical protein